MIVCKKKVDKCFQFYKRKSRYIYIYIHEIENSFSFVEPSKDYIDLNCLQRYYTVNNPNRKILVLGVVESSPNIVFKEIIFNKTICKEIKRIEIFSMKLFAIKMCSTNTIIVLIKSLK